MRAARLPKAPLPARLDVAYARLRPDLTFFDVSAEIDRDRSLMLYTIELGHAIPARTYARRLASYGLAVLRGHGGGGR